MPSERAHGIDPVSLALDAADKAQRALVTTATPDSLAQLLAVQQAVALSYEEQVLIPAVPEDSGALAEEPETTLIPIATCLRVRGALVKDTALTAAEAKPRDGLTHHGYTFNDAINSAGEYPPRAVLPTMIERIDFPLHHLDAPPKSPGTFAHFTHIDQTGAQRHFYAPCNDGDGEVSRVAAFGQTPFEEIVNQATAEAKKDVASLVWERDFKQPFFELQKLPGVEPNDYPTYRSWDIPESDHHALLAIVTAVWEQGREAISPQELTSWLLDDPYALRRAVINLEQYWEGGVPKGRPSCLICAGWQPLWTFSGKPWRSRWSLRMNRFAKKPCGS